MDSKYKTGYGYQPRTVLAFQFGVDSSPLWFNIEYPGGEHNFQFGDYIIKDRSTILSLTPDEFEQQYEPL